MAMDPNKKKTIIAASAISFILIVGLLVMLFLLSGDEPAPTSSLGKSDAMAPAARAPEAAPGQLQITPSTISFPNDQPGTIQVRLTARGGPVVIGTVAIPSMDADAITVQNLDCPQAPERLEAEAFCSASVTWTGVRTINAPLNIQTSTVDKQGQNVPSLNPTVIPIVAVSTKPVEVPGLAGQVNDLPRQGAPAGATASNGAANGGSYPDDVNLGNGGPVGPSPQEQYREAYVQARRTQAPQVARPQALRAAATSSWTSWDNIGVTSASSSMPTDMSRVITPDKPLSAVLTVPIDTRSTVTAVAMVDRDIYGNNGRTIVVPRGSKLIGRVAPNMERVGIQWTNLIRPDGARFIFAANSGDAMGRGGIPGRINERNVERYGYTLLSGMVSAGTAIALGGQQSQTSGVGGGGGAIQTQDSRAIATEIFRQSLDSIGQDFFNRKRNIPVQITVATGTRITVWATTDLRLKAVGEPEVPRAAPVAGANDEDALFAGGANIDPTRFQQQQAAPAAGQPAGSSAAPANTNMAVGRVDASGNYIPPGAPSPGPSNMSTSRVEPANGTMNGAAPSGRAPWEQ